jgi:hypothetical protein
MPATFAGGIEKSLLGFKSLTTGHRPHRFIYIVKPIAIIHPICR